MYVNYFKDGTISFLTALGIGIPTGLVGNIISVLILAVITGVIIPLLRILFRQLFLLLNKKGVISDDELNEIINKQKKAIDELEKEVEKLKDEEGEN